MCGAPLAGLSLLAFLVATPATADAAGSRFSHTGDAYGTQVKLGSTVKSGPTALVTVGCGAEAGVHKENTVLDVDLLPVGFTGTVRTTADTSSGPTRTRFTAETERVVLLGGLITADLVRAVSTITHDGSAFQASGAESTFVNLRVAGDSISATPPPNTKIALAGFGSVTLNEQVKSVGTKKASLTVRMIHVTISQANLLGIAVGTDIIVSHARSTLTGPVTAFLDGKAYGTSANLVGSTIQSGPSALVTMPCLGTGGVLKTNEIALVNLPGIITSGTVYSTAQGTVSSGSASGEMTSRVQGVNVLNGFITADVVKADAHASSDGTTPSFSDQGSGLVNLSIAGHPTITADAKPNTKVSLPGLGTLYIHRVIQNPDSIEVRMIELKVTTFPKAYGLAIGSNIRVAVARASVH